MAEQTIAPFDTTSFHREMVVNRGLELARERERHVESLLRDNLPRPLHWLIDHPRLLKRVLRVVKRWEPTMIFVDLNPAIRAADGHLPGTPYRCSISEAAGHFAGRWVRENEERVRKPALLVFTFTNASGLPAEVYCVR